MSQGSEFQLYRGNTQHWSILRNRENFLQERSATTLEPPPIQFCERDVPPTPTADDRKHTMQRSNSQNQYHKRALEKFEYWLIDRPKPTTFGKYGMGSRHTVLGIGNAPRT